ncbi:MAG TPA: hypothetical protein VG755_12790 [Nannocystaceae bacterium]|nr:hypothetical protein [Nannocystaceae bacterium]
MMPRSARRLALAICVLSGCRSDTDATDGDTSSSGDSTSSTSTSTTSSSTTIAPESSGAAETSTSSDGPADSSSSSGGCTTDCDAPPTTLWEVSRDGEAHNDDRFAAVAIADDGAVIVNGFVAEATPSRDVAVVAFAADGTESWAYVTGASAQDDVGTDVAIVDGDVVATATRDGTAMQWLARIDEGVAAWEYEASGSAHTVAVLGGGIVAGGVADARGYVGAFDGNDGTPAWTWSSPIAGGCATCDRILDVEVLANADIAAVGARGEDGTAVVVRLSPDGSEIWSAADDAPGTALRLTAEASGDLLVIVRDDEEVTQLRRYPGDGSGHLQLPSDPDEQLADIASDPLGGWVVAANLADGVAIRHYDARDAIAWADTRDAPADGELIVSAIAVDGAGEVAACGTRRVDDVTGYDGWVIVLAP